MALAFSGDALRWTIIVATIIVALFLIIANTVVAVEGEKENPRMAAFLDRTTGHGVMLFGLIAIALALQPKEQ